MIETSSNLPWRSSEILANFRKMFVWPPDIFEESAEIFGKWSEIFRKIVEELQCLSDSRSSTIILELLANLRSNLTWSTGGYMKW